MIDKSRKLKDLPAKLIGIPLAGILVTMLYSLVSGNAKISWTITDYVSFSVISFAIWIVNSSVLYLLRSHLYKIKKVYFRLPLRFGINIILTWIISLILLNLWNVYIHKSEFSSNTIIVLQVIMTIITVQIGAVYEIVYLNNERESDIVKIERSEKSKIQSQLDALKSQLDPHFMFNSLNTLSYLITQNQQNARLFNDTLAKVYRYILLNKEKDLVLLKEEIEFASNYFYLLKIRYQKGLNMKIEIDDIVSENYLLPPLSLQMLIENAIKHNNFLDKSPLSVEINVSKDQVVVTNNRSVKQFEMQSNKIGLLNLNERYKLITNNHIEILQDQHFFKVKLPILKS